MSLIFLTSNLDPDAKALLKSAYDRAHEKLIALPGIERADLSADDLASALMELFASGLRDEAKLTRDAVFNVVRGLTERPLPAAE